MPTRGSTRALEEHVLAALIAAEIAQAGVLESMDVGPEDFDDQELRAGFRALTEIVSAGEVPLPENLQARTSSAIGKRLSRLLEGELLPTHPEALTKAVRQLREIRRCDRWAAAYAQAAARLEDGEDLDTQLAWLRDLDSNEGRTEKVHTIRDTLKETLSLVERAQLGGASVYTGIPEIDKVCPPSPGSVLVIGARPSVGKTALAVALSSGIASSGQGGVLYVSAEMSRETLGARFLAQESGVPTSKLLRKAGLSDLDYGRMAAAFGRIADTWPVYTMTDARLDRVLVEAIRMKRRGEIVALVVDYLQLLETRERDTREQEIASISRRLAVACHGSGLLGIVLSQLSRLKRENKRPILSDLRESGAIEQDADDVWLLYRPGLEEGGADETLEVGLGKSRNGPAGMVVEVPWESGRVVISKEEREVPNRGT